LRPQLKRDPLGTGQPSIISDMTIASWSPRTIVWLWIGLLGCYAILIAAGAIQERRARRLSGPSMDIGSVAAETTHTTLSPAQIARRDSLVDSLKRLGRFFLDSRQGQATVRSLTAALSHATNGLVLALALLLTPVVVLFIITIVWFTGRHAAVRRTGA